MTVYEFTKTVLYGMGQDGRHPIYPSASTTADGVPDRAIRRRTETNDELDRLADNN